MAVKLTQQPLPMAEVVFHLPFPADDALTHHFFFLHIIINYNKSRGASFEALVTYKVSVNLRPMHNIRVYI